jgi:hypothetical protein
MDMVRNGSYMIRQVVFNPTAFSHPVTAFLLGITNIWFYIMVELMNIYASLARVKTDVILSRFVSYAMLMTIPQIYMRQKKMFNVKFDVEDFFLTIKKDDETQYLETTDSTMANTSYNSELNDQRQIIRKAKKEAK